MNESQSNSYEPEENIYVGEDISEDVLQEYDQYSANHSCFGCKELYRHCTCSTKCTKCLKDANWCECYGGPYGTQFRTYAGVVSGSSLSDSGCETKNIRTGKLSNDVEVESTGSQESQRFGQSQEIGRYSSSQSTNRIGGEDTGYESRSISRSKQMVRSVERSSLLLSKDEFMKIRSEYGCYSVRVDDVRKFDSRLGIGIRKSAPQVQRECGNCGRYGHITSYCRVKCSKCRGNHLTAEHSRRTQTKGNRFGPQRKMGNRKSKQSWQVKKSNSTYIPRVIKVNKVSVDTAPFMEVVHESIVPDMPLSIIECAEVLVEEKINPFLDIMEKEDYPKALVDEQIDMLRTVIAEHDIVATFRPEIWDVLKKMSHDKFGDNDIISAREIMSKFTLREIGILTKREFMIFLGEALHQIKKNWFEAKVVITLVAEGPIVKSLYDLRTDLKKRVDMKHPDSKNVLYKVEVKPLFTFNGLLIPEFMYEYQMIGDRESCEHTKRAYQHLISTDKLEVSMELLAQVMGLSVSGFTTDQQTLWNKINFAVTYNNDVNIDRYGFGLVEQQTALFAYLLCMKQRQVMHLPFQKTPKVQKELESDTVLQKLVSLALGFLKKKLNLSLAE